MIHKHPMYHICDSPALVSQGVQHDRPVRMSTDKLLYLDNEKIGHSRRKYERAYL